MNNSIYKGDDTDAFGSDFITINLDNPNNIEVTKAIFSCGCIVKTFEPPKFPLKINLTSEETKRLKKTNVCHLVVYDAQGRRKTCDGTLTFEAKDGVQND